MIIGHIHPGAVGKAGKAHRLRKSGTNIKRRRPAKNIIRRRPGKLWIKCMLSVNLTEFVIHLLLICVTIRLC